jgi:hypothetical protein
MKTEDNLNCPYCQEKQSNLYGSGTDCSGCGNYIRIKITAKGFISLYRHKHHLQYRLIRKEYKEQLNIIFSKFELNNNYFKQTTKNKSIRNEVVKFANSIGMTPYKIKKFHNENGSNLSFMTIIKIINNEK